MNKIFPFYPGFVSRLMSRLASHWKTTQWARTGFEVFDSSCTTLMDRFLVVAKALISAPLTCWKGADLERRERQELYQTNKQTNKLACLCPQCRLTSGSQGSSAWMSTRWLPLEVWGNVMGGLSHMNTHTQTVHFSPWQFEKCHTITGAEEAGLFPIQPFFVYYWLTYNI